MSESSSPAGDAASQTLNVIVYSPPVDFTALSIAALLKCCLDHNHADAWEEFVRRFHRTIAGAICKTLRLYGSCDPALVEDLVQDTFVRLCADRCRSLRQFQATDEASFYGFLRATAVNAARDHYRRVHSVKRRAEACAEPIDSVLNDGVAARESEQAYHDSLMLQRIDGLLRSGDAAGAERNRLIFWLHYRDGFSASEIARLHSVGLTAKGVETVLRRLMEDVRGGGLSAGGGGRTHT